MIDQGVVRRAPPRPERLVSVPQLARMVGVSRRTMLRRVMSLHARHGGDWLGHFGRKKLLVNLSLFRRCHPFVFSVDVVQRDEFEELQDRVKELEEKVATEKSRTNNGLYRIRQLEEEKRRSQTGTG